MAWPAEAIRGAHELPDFQHSTAVAAISILRNGSCTRERKWIGRYVVRSFTVRSSPKLAYSLAGTALGGRTLLPACVQSSPTNAGPAVADLMPCPAHPDPSSHTSRVRGPSTCKLFAVVRGLLPLAVPLLPDMIKFLCLRGVGSARLADRGGELGWAGLGWAAGSSCLFRMNASGVRRGMTIESTCVLSSNFLLPWPFRPAQHRYLPNGCGTFFLKSPIDTPALEFG